MVIYGDYTNSDTRAILAALRVSGMAFQFINLDVLSNQHHHNEVFAKISPSKDFPVITEGNFIIINSVVKNMKYLCASKPMMQKKLWPNDNQK